MQVHSMSGTLQRPESLELELQSNPCALLASPYSFNGDAQNNVSRLNQVYMHSRLAWLRGNALTLNRIWVMDAGTVQENGDLFTSDLPVLQQACLCAKLLGHSLFFVLRIWLKQHIMQKARPNGYVWLSRSHRREDQLRR